MHHIFVLFSFLLLTSSLYAEQLIRSVTFAEDPLTVIASPGNQLQPLLDIDDPGISSSVYALKGMIRYQNVEGEGFLQLDNHFGAEGTYFTRSMASSGPLGKISGSSDWRPFVLPFRTESGEGSDDKVSAPEALSLTLYLPGSGTVSFRDVGLYEYASGEDPLQPSEQWFSDRSLGLFGGVAGSLVGLWAGLLGVLSSGGKARRFVLGSVNALLLVGVVGIAGGVTAFATDQPHNIYNPLLLTGIILVAVMGKLRSILPARYELLELKRMQSMDI